MCDCHMYFTLTYTYIQNRVRNQSNFGLRYRAMVWILHYLSNCWVSCWLVLYCVHVHALSYRTLFDRGASLRRRSNDAREFVRLRETQCSSRVAVVVGRNVSKPSWSHCNTGRPVRLLNTRVTPFRHLCRRQCRRRACLLGERCLRCPP